MSTPQARPLPPGPTPVYLAEPVPVVLPQVVIWAAWAVTVAAGLTTAAVGFALLVTIARGLAGLDR